MNRLRNYEIQKRYDFALESVYALGAKALAMCQGEVTMTRKPDGSKVTSVDTTLNDMFINAARREFPDDLVWGEEASNSEKGDLAAAENHWVWMIDPIDGTSGFWRCYQQGKFKNCTATTLLTAFAPGETTPTLSVVHNPFQTQQMTLSATPEGALYHTSSAVYGRQVFVPPNGPTCLGDVRRFEKSDWGSEVPSLSGVQDMMPYARRLHHQLFMAAVALGDSDLSAFSGPSYPHDVAANAHIVHRAGGTVRSLRGEDYEQVDWRVDPVRGVLATATPQLAEDFFEKLVA